MTPRPGSCESTPTKDPNEVEPLDLNEFVNRIRDQSETTLRNVSLCEQPNLVPSHLTFKDIKTQDGDFERYSVFLSYRLHEDETDLRNKEFQFVVFCLERKSTVEVDKFDLTFGAGKKEEQFQTPNVHARLNMASEDDYRKAFWQLMNTVFFREKRTHTVKVDLMPGSYAAPIFSQNLSGCPTSYAHFRKVNVYLNRNTDGAISSDALKWPGTCLGKFCREMNLGDYKVRASLTAEENATMIQKIAQPRSNRFTFNKFSIEPNGEGGAGKINFHSLVDASKGFSVEEKMIIKPEIVLGEKKDDVTKFGEFMTEVLAVGRENGVCVVKISINRSDAAAFQEVLDDHFGRTGIYNLQRGAREYDNTPRTIRVTMEDSEQSRHNSVEVTFTAADSEPNLLNFLRAPQNPEANAN